MTEAMDVLSRAEDSLDDQAARDRLRSERAVLLADTGRVRAASQLAAGLVEDLDAAIDDRLRALGAVGRSWALGGQARRVLAVSESLAGHAHDRRADMHRAPSWVFQAASVAMLSLGDLEGVDALIASHDLDADARSPEVRAQHELIRARVLLLRGRPATAAVVLREVAAELHHGDAERWRPWALALLAEAYAVLGDRGRATDALVLAEHSPSGGRLFLADVDRARAWVAAAGGELSSARSQLLALADASRRRGEYVVEAHALHNAVRFGAVAEAAPRLDELRWLDGSWSQPFADHAVALLRDDGPALDEVAEAFESVGAIRFAVEAASCAAHAHGRIAAPSSSGGIAAARDGVGRPVRDGRAPRRARTRARWRPAQPA